MARNSEKAMAMLNRWHQMKHNIVTGSTGRRPRMAEDSDNTKECEYWRHQIVREVTRKIADIQNAALGEHRIRELNDDINRLLKEKSRWEDRIKELGGPDYKAASTRVVEAMGSELVASSETGYKYFGAAKDLPGVREMIEKEAATAAPASRSRAQLYRNIKPDYYGWRDEEDPRLLDAERRKEAELQRELLAKWKAQHPSAVPTAEHP